MRENGGERMGKGVDEMGRGSKKGERLSVGRSKFPLEIPFSKFFFKEKQITDVTIF